VSITVKWFRTTWMQLLKPITEKYCWKVSQCCTITPVCILPPTPLKASINCTLRCWSILRSANLYNKWKISGSIKLQIG
jgi:hypothetical protein